jgi:hypothetical protein
MDRLLECKLLDDNSKLKTLKSDHRPTQPHIDAFILCSGRSDTEMEDKLRVAKELWDVNLSGMAIPN